MMALMLQLLGPLVSALVPVELPQLSSLFFLIVAGMLVLLVAATEHGAEVVLVVHPLNMVDLVFWTLGLLASVLVQAEMLESLAAFALAVVEMSVLLSEARYYGAEAN